MAWPQLNQIGVRGSYYQGDWDCATRGHKYGQARFYPADKSILFQTCKKCGIKHFTQIVIIDGKFQELELKTGF